MDSLITAAARALATGDPFGALNLVALRQDAPALALRGVAMAQIGDLDRAKDLLKRAARRFGPGEATARARCLVAEAEIALVSRDLGWPRRTLDAAREVLERHGDRLNAAHARGIEARRLLLVGRIDEAERAFDGVDPAQLPPALAAGQALTLAGVALRRLRTAEARAHLEAAGRAAHASGISGLVAEVEAAGRALTDPAARLIARGEERVLLLEEVEALQASGALVVDACRYVVRDPDRSIPLASRPVLFALARALAESFPSDCSREALLKCAFGAREADESHRARLRVEIGRLRAALKGMAEIAATKRGFAIAPGAGRGIVVLARPVEERHATALALLSDGEAWSSSALALALGESQRNAQRALEQLAADGKVGRFGRGRARRWTTAPLAGITTTLLLPAFSTGD